jgi:hypothetical protein
MTVKTILFILIYFVLFGAVAYGKWRVRLLLPYRAMNFIAGGFGLFCLAVVWAAARVASVPLRRMTEVQSPWIFHTLIMTSLVLSAYGWWRMAHDQMRFFDHLRRRQRTTGERPAFAPPKEATEKDCISGATLVWRICSVSLIGLLSLGFFSTRDMALAARLETAKMAGEVQELSDEVLHLTDKINDVSEFLRQQKLKQTSDESRRQFDDAIEMLKRPRRVPSRHQYADGDLPVGKGN